MRPFLDVPAIGEVLLVNLLGECVVLSGVDLALGRHHEGQFGFRPSGICDALDRGDVFGQLFVGEGACFAGKDCVGQCRVEG